MFGVLQAYSAELLIAQSFGLIALAADIVALLSTNDRKLKYWLAVAAGLLSVHFYLLGAFAGAAMAFIAASRFLMSVYTSARPFLWGYVAIYIIAGVVTYREAVDLLPIAGGMISTVAVFTCSGIRLRASIALASFCWLIHNIIQLSIGGILMETVFLTANAFTIRKLWKLRHI